MKTQRRNIRNYVLVYSETGDPSREATAEALDQMGPVSPREVIPGTIAVTGSRSDVERCADGLDQWHLAPERVFELNPPHKSQLR